MKEVTRKVRYELFQFYLQECCPPTEDELAKLSGLGSCEIPSILRKPEEEHRIVLYTHESCAPTPMAMAHPFPHLPIPFIVSEGERSWWANCIWCAPGLAAMLAPDKAIISVGSGSMAQEVQVVVQGDELKVIYLHRELSTSDCCAHFSVPPSTWWRDVRFVCGTIQLFKSKQGAQKWPQKRGFHTGEILSLETAWSLSKAWYHNKHQYDYDRKSAADVTELYRSLGMTVTSGSLDMAQSAHKELPSNVRKVTVPPLG
ncbi:hypothetical protein A7D00_5696 [Trichophyton violaceum]|uniref:Alkylmercury lyase n=1 Tax=Trichophyton violaceum TaxID=34388 RepID=A0A178FE03_TRIVO|nr:hypothetical protein A7D00_5696 [Trichophyton violaceum]